MNLFSNILSSVVDATPKSAMMSLIIGLKSRACVLIYGENIIRRGHDIHLHNGDGEDLAGVSKVFSAIGEEFIRVHHHALCTANEWNPIRQLPWCIGVNSRREGKLPYPPRHLEGD